MSHSVAGIELLLASSQLAMKGTRPVGLRRQPRVWAAVATSTRAPGSQDARGRAEIAETLIVGDRYCDLGGVGARS